jgi:ABC-type Fe3+-hydroxamate transport system substrate-binding protein
VRNDLFAKSFAKALLMIFLVFKTNKKQMNFEKSHIRFIDGIGAEFYFENSPKRIVSLVPSQTELLFDLGLEDSIVGITKFCVHPPHLKATKTIVGGTKNVKFEKIKALSPDIIICNK